MLLAVTGVFLVCTLPGAINTIVSRLLPEYSRMGKQSNLYLTVSQVTYFLETFNSSVNFVIYMLFSRRFCHTYQEIFCRCTTSNLHLKTVRFVQPSGGLGAVGSRVRSRSSASARGSLQHEMHCMQYRPLPPPLFPTSSGAQRTRYLTNGFLRSSFDVDDVMLLNTQPSSRPVANGNGPARNGTCCVCRQKEGSTSRSRSRSRSHSHSSDSAAQQYS
jgi:hypothetical protein